MTEETSPEPPTPAGARPSDDDARGAARGQIIGWAALAAFSAAVIELRLPMPLGGARVRALHHAYDAGQMLAAGLASAAAVEAWRRWAPRRRGLGLAALAAASLGIGALAVSEDVEIAAAKLPGPTLPWQALLVAVIALAVPAAAALGLFLARPGAAARGSPRALAARRALTAAIGLALAAVNHLVLPNDYPGVHLYLAWTAALSIGIAAWVDAPPPAGRRRSAGLALRAAAAVAAAASLVVRPPSNVTVELARSGAVLAPFVLRAHSATAGHLPAGGGEWLADRSGLPPIPPSQPPLVPKDAIVLMLTIDALRADVVAGDRHADVLPNLAALRRESVEFTAARSPSPQTNASIATLFAGKYFSQMYWSVRPNSAMWIPCAHEDPTPRFTEILAQGGVATVTYAAMPGLVNANGIVRGFQEEQVVPGRPFATAKQITDVAVERIRRQGGGPMFLYIHFTDSHAPYNLAGTQGTAFDRYLREVGLVDAALGRIRKAVVESGLEQRTTLIISADHGEAFGEHRSQQHATTVYEELLRVPLLVRVPGVAPRAVDAPVLLLDLGPTVLDLMGFPTPGSYMGQSLAPLLRGGSAPLTRPLAFESSRGLRAMVFPDGWKAITNRRQGTFELYDLTRDPGELRDLVGEGGADEKARLDALTSFFFVHELRRPGYEIPYIR